MASPMPKYLRILTADHPVLTAGGLSGFMGFPSGSTSQGETHKAKKPVCPMSATNRVE